KGFRKTFQAQRATEVQAVIEQKEEGTDFGQPPWWTDYVDLRQNRDIPNWQQGHLLGKRFGGPGLKDSRNRVPISRLLNTAGFNICDNAIEKALKCGCVIYRAVVQYTSDITDTINPLRPWAIRISAESESGFSFVVKFTVDNNWHEIYNQAGKCKL